jgi:hypothetical protein
MLVLCFFLCIFAVLNTRCVNSSAIMGFRGIKKQQHKATSYILFQLNLYNFVEKTMQDLYNKTTIFEFPMINWTLLHLRCYATKEKVKS